VQKDSRLATSVAVVVLVIVASSEIFRIQLGDLLVGKSIADTRVQFIQRLPLKLVVGFGQESRGCNGTSQSRSPDRERAIVLGESAL
jgi:hypothetical protein